MLQINNYFASYKHASSSACILRLWQVSNNSAYVDNWTKRLAAHGVGLGFMLLSFEQEEENSGVIDMYLYMRISFVQHLWCSLPVE